ncbi:MAG: polysaccharide deacetylase family protein [Flavobacteriaceae bacterium]|jgi:peptidoglycan/xylan/chitin deacetylase (PgdA/CDA1 family)|nr:polysaccharide deacetylase family protein [Flavobacteriaceae bacterium]
MKFITNILSILYPKLTWIRATTEKKIYLTFDDGPIPEITEWVLDLLKHDSIKATFFCIGDNIRKHPHIFQRIIAEGHQIGNHTYNHLNGWKTSDTAYLHNIELCDIEIKKYCKTSSKLFRPPYGKIKKQQSKALLQQGKEIVMWTTITKDYDVKTSPEECLNLAMTNLRPGAILVFHDSIKASRNMKFALPKAIEALKEQGYTFATL